uniref:Secreted protein n=1 Tax=Heterorhabditis bacteriophora TaxID=37862 RepID=A0A1I7WFD8_HETBA
MPRHVLLILPGVGVFFRMTCFSDSWTKERPIVLKVKLAVHTEIHYLLIAEILLSIVDGFGSGREGGSANPNSQLRLLFSLKLKIWAFIFKTMYNYAYVLLGIMFHKADVYHDVCASSTRLHILQVTQVIHMLNFRNAQYTLAKNIFTISVAWRRSYEREAALCSLCSLWRTVSKYYQFLLVLKFFKSWNYLIIEGLPTKDGSFRGRTTCGVLGLFLSNEQYYVLDNLVSEGAISI